MKFEQTFRVGLRDIGIDNKLTNYGILSYLEDIGTAHSDTVGFGVKDIYTKHRAWLLMDWKLNVIKRLEFGENVTVKTWTPIIEKQTFHVYRNFEVLNENGEVIATATSKWIFYDTENLKIVKVDESFIDLFKAEGSEKEAADQITRLKEPSSFESIYEYVINRGDIDVNKHMHNLNYLKLAYEALPEDVFFGEEPKSLHIMYKNQIKLGAKVKCFYSFEDNKHFVTIKSEDEKILHAIVELQKGTGTL